MKNKHMIFVKRPIGEPDDECFRLVEDDVPELKKNQILVKVCWLSLDPYMRGRMNDVKSYVAPMQIGDVMTGESSGIVVKSNSEKFTVGDHVAVHKGWQSYIVCDDDEERLMKINLDNGDLAARLGVVGMPGRTAFFGLIEVGKPKAGETLVGAAASGAVGSAVGQIAKILGLRAVGIAGGTDKCRYVTEELGFDDCIDYKAGNLGEELRIACPEGVTRQTVVDLCHEHDIDIRIKPCTQAELYRADECFCTGTMGELAPVTQVDGRTIGSGEIGSMTQRLSGLFDQCVAAEAEPVLD